MEFGLSQDQRLLDESIRKYLSSEVPLDTIRTLATTDETDAAVWQGLSELGLAGVLIPCLLYTSPSPRDRQKSRMPSSA